MKNTFRLILCLYLMISMHSCKTTTPVSKVTSDDTLPKDQVAAEGTIQKQGTTSYQYGTHVLKDTEGNTIYALKSDAVNLDTFLNKKITVVATKVEGYPIEGGPDYLEVIKIKE